MMEFTPIDIENATEKIIPFIASKSPNKNGKAILLVGQPAAGKSVATREFSSEYINIDADDYRIFHPHFDELNKNHGRNASSYTGRFAGAVCEEVIKYCAKQNYNIIVQGTGRNIDTLINTTAILEDNGYTDISLKIVACPVELSTLSIYKRYLEQKLLGSSARFSDIEHTKIVLTNLPNNIEEYYQKASKNVSIINRDGEVLWNPASPRHPSHVLNQEFVRPLTTREQKNFVALKELVKKANPENSDVELERITQQIERIKDCIIAQ